MAYLERRPIGGLVRRPITSPWQAPSGGGRPSNDGAGVSSGGGGEVVNPWQAAFQRNYGESAARPYEGDWRTAVSRSMALGQKDYTSDLRRMAQEDVSAEQKNFQNRLGAMGMSELSLRDDVTADWAKKRQDASTRAAIEGQGMQQSAIDTMRGMLGSATGAELDRLSQMIQAASAGGGNYNQFMSMLVPLMEKYGAASRSGVNGKVGV